MHTHPYTMLKESPNKLVGNDRFEGYCIDLIKELSEILGFSFKFHLVADRKYGQETNNVTKEWNGMIGEVMRGRVWCVTQEADLAIVDLSITSKRQSVVDFTMPFMHTGISILFKKPTEKSMSLFSFLSPFSTEVWAYMICAYIGVSITLFIVGRLSPYEWENPHPCRQEDQVLENNFSLLNSLWFTIGSVMQQGSDLEPRCVPDMLCN
ncbi:hypothetical protein LAZ67_18002466 [Cordylochernes scorpioides]|uniref:Glutamate receptor ionotropic, kainate 2 n=1 Tax=Cordylochernes scorpioides TaxID=51811 RepID=A0ABY6LKU6_9ARAC|nr:hypothetical protein LAZ67_18002466 [Cordylochernes scorpioides]